MDFDIFTGLICVLIALSSGFVIYGISKLTMKGYSSYDDVMASRRQEKSRPASTDRNSEAKKLKKIKKKLKKESMTSAGAITAAEDTPVEEEITVAQSQEEITEIPSVVLVPPKAEEKAPSTITASKVKNKVKAPKKVEDPVIEVAEIVAKKAPEVTSEPVVEAEPSPKHESKITYEIAAQIEYDASNNSVDEEGSSNDNGKMKKKIKKKKENSVEETGKLTLQSLLPLLKQAEFSHGEVQILIDALLNKDDSEWLKGKQDPMLKLKKQVMEMEKLHADDTETINGLQVKLATLRSELNSEKSNNKTFRETLAKANTDIQAITVKFQQLSEEKESLHMNIQQLKQQLNEEHIIVHKLQEEKLLITQMNISHEQHHEAIVALQSQVNQLAAQLNEEQTMNANLGAQIEDSLRLEEEYRQVSAMNVELDHHLSNSQFEVNRLNTEILNLAKQLEESRSENNELNNVIETIELEKHELQSECELLKREVAKANHEARQYQKMADTLEHNLEENKKNGNIGFHNDHSECQALLDEKNQVLDDLSVELNQKDAAIEKLKTEMIAFKNDSNKKQGVIDALNVELTSLKASGAITSSELNEEKNSKTTLCLHLAEKADTISKLTKEVDTHKHRNNELRSKNWKVVEALEKAEASLQEMSLKLKNQSTIYDAVVRNIKTRISQVMEPFILTTNFGDISGIEDINLWVDKVEELITVIHNEPKTDQLLAQNAKLQSLNTHYRSVINDLEQMLLNLELKIASANKNQKASSHPQIEVDD